LCILYLSANAQTEKDLISIQKVNSKYPFNERVNDILKDNHGFIWVATPKGPFRYDGSRFLKFDQFGDLPSVNAFQEDSLQNLWLATSNGLYMIPERRDTLYSFLIKNPEKAEDIENKFVGVRVDDKNVVWCLTYSGQLYKVVNQKITPVTVDPRIREQFINTSKLVIEGNTLWISANRSLLFQLDFEGKLLQKFNYQSDYGDFIVKNDVIIIEDEGRITQIDKLNTEKKILDQRPYNLNKVAFTRLFDNGKDDVLVTRHKGILASLAGHKVQDLTEYFPKDFQLSNRIISFYKDENKQVWMGTLEGLYLLTSRQELIKPLLLPTIENNRSEQISFRAIVQISQDELLVASYQGLFTYHLHKKTFTPHLIEKNGELLPVTTAYTLFPYENEVLIGTEGDGILRFNPKTGHFRRFSKNNIDQQPGMVFTVEDANDKIIMGSMAGLFYAEKDRQKILPFQKTESDLMKSHIMATAQINDSLLWVGGNTGLFLADLRSSKSTFIPLLVSNLMIRAMFWDGSSLWIGSTNQGLIKYHHKTSKTRLFSRQDGLANTQINSIIAGKDQALWISTDDGISRLDTAQNSFTNYFVDSWQEKNEYNHSASFQAQDGTIYFGGVNRAIYFNPLNIKKENKTFTILPAEVVRYNEEVHHSIHTNFSLAGAPAIDITPEDKYFSIQFSSLEAAAEKVKYYYRIKEISEEWQYLDEQQQVQFPGLSPGNYTLELKGQNRYANWSPIEILPIRVFQIWYKQWWAVLLFISTAFIIILFIVFLFIQNKNDQRKLLLEQMHVAKLQELDEAKTRIFSNLAHEFRTPLTLIQGPAELLSNAKNQPRIKQAGSLIRKQSQSMLALINQLLDISSIDSGKEKLKITSTNLDTFVWEIQDQWKNAFDEKGVLFEIEYKLAPQLFLEIDADKLEKMVRNLLSNAYKFTPKGGKVNLKIEAISRKHLLHITVKDDGVGMSPEVKGRIFDRFYQADNTSTRETEGTGIGLSLVKEYAELMLGSIAVQSKSGEGSTFHLTVPYHHTDAIPQENKKIDVQEKSVAESKKRYSILIVEDNLEVSRFIVSCLEEQYDVITAENGEEGKKKANDALPDMVITDWMMPKMDGLTLIKQLKSGLLTAHIPVVLLTAKAKDQDRLNGRASGADSYLSKPFSAVELLQILQNLITLRNRIAINQNGKINPLADNQQDLFLKKIDQFLLNNIEKTDITVEDFLEHLGVSRTQLHRKIKSTTGKSINQYTREYRLHYAWELIQKQPSMSVAEVSYASGFNSPSYFSGKFKEYFQKSPKA
jgi:signal transduction histidine kinase/CheY-like chemotaxis protein/ligand-binding sensor domain-containing protein